MHEMGLVSSILEAVRKEMDRCGCHHVEKIGLRIGEFAGVDPDSLSFCFEAQIKGTEMEGVALDVEWRRVAEGGTGEELDLAYLELEAG
jgi:hydrogenase nickel incorporation protein HypA/HybF